MANYERELRMGGDIRKKEKVEKATKFVERMKKVQCYKMRVWTDFR